MNRIVSCLCAVSLLIVLGACSTSARHTPKAYIQVGQSLPIEVTISNPEEGISISGTIHYRLGVGSYISKPMQGRGSSLYTELPAGNVPAGSAVEYYIDVRSGPKLLALGSPASPFRVDVYNRQQIIQISLKHYVDASFDDQPIRFVLQTGRVVPDSAKVSYQMPAVSGQTSAPMQRQGNQFSYTVPATVVHAGFWGYKIMVVVDGKSFNMPDKGMTKFEVKIAPPPPPPPPPAPPAPTQ